jgi:hypothetical protein
MGAQRGNGIIALTGMISVIGCSEWSTLDPGHLTPTKSTVTHFTRSWFKKIAKLRNENSVVRSSQTAYNPELSDDSSPPCVLVSLLNIRMSNDDF